MRPAASSLPTLSLVILVLAAASGGVMALAECGGRCDETPQTWQQWFKDLIIGSMPNFNMTLPVDLQDDDLTTPFTVKFYLFHSDNMKFPETYMLNATMAGEIVPLDLDPNTNTYRAASSRNAAKQIYKGFDRHRCTKIIVHGWLGELNSEFVTTMLKAYLPLKDCNVIIMDWYRKARKLYPYSRNAVPILGKVLASYIDLLFRQYKVFPQMLHIVGHSLGAHISGIAGRLVTTGPVGRITGLDPALPMFSTNHQDTLGKDAAVFVDVIHTCGNFLGWNEPLGHADFYPNKGVHIQPGCGADVVGECSHGRAWLYFAESIAKPRLFLAFPCDSWEVYLKKRNTCGKNFASMGEHLSIDTRGIYYLKTNAEAPFGRGYE